MKKIAAGILCLAVCAGLQAQQMRIKIATIAPARSTWDIEENAIAQEWSKITGGQVTLQFMSATAMGGESGVVQKLNSVRPGQRPPIGGAVFTSLGVNELVPEANILTISVPGLFKNQSEVNKALEKFSDEMKTPILEKGYVVLGWFSVGWVYFYTKNLARTPDQLKKQRLCVGSLTAPALSNAFKAAGYSTMDVSGDKLLQSMKTPGGVEGVYTIPMYAYAAQYCKVIPYVLDIPLCPVMAAFLISKDVWDDVPEKYKPEMLAAVKKAEAKFTESQEKDDTEYLQRCQESGATLVTLTPEEEKIFRDSFDVDSRKMYEAKDPVVKKSLYDKIVAFIKEIRGE